MSPHDTIARLRKKWREEMRDSLERLANLETNKWGRVECAYCGAAGPEVRTNYEHHDSWGGDAVKEWNTRKETKTDE